MDFARSFWRIDANGNWVPSPHEETIRRHIRRGILPAVKVGRQYMVWASDAARYIASQMAKPQRIPKPKPRGRPRRRGRPRFE